MVNDKTPLRYLCLTAKGQLERDIDNWWARIVGDRPIWGPGFEGWDDGLSLDDNLRRRFGDLSGFDAIFLSHVFTTTHEAGSWEPPSGELLGAKPTVVLSHEVIGVFSFGVPVAQRGDMCSFDGVDVVLHPYAEHELDSYYARRELCRAREPNRRAARQIFARIPHHVRTDLFTPPEGGDSTRDIDVLLVGRCDADLYPLRARWERFVADGCWENAVHLAAPYGRPCEWTPKMIDQQMREYAAHLRRARVVLACSSYWRYMLGKYTEIAASGAFLVSDVCTQMPLEFFENMGIVTNGMRDRELVEMVSWWLAAREERERRAARLCAFVREHLDMARFWAKTDDEVRRWKAGYAAGR